MAALVDLTGREFGRLTVIRRAQATPGKTTGARWVARCSCVPVPALRPQITVAGKDLTRGRTRSCGCLRIEALAVTRARLAARQAGPDWYDPDSPNPQLCPGCFARQHCNGGTSFCECPCTEQEAYECQWCKTHQPADQMMPVLFATEEGGSGWQCRDDRACTKRQKASKTR
jgi:hypothetical protein